MKRLYNGFKIKLNTFFNNNQTEYVVIALVLISVIVALSSIFFTSNLLENLNLIFSILFCIELSLRYIARESTRNYFSTFTLDWIASIPWSNILIYFLPVTVSLTFLKLLRIPRLFRLFRFVRLKRNGVFSRLGYLINRQVEKSFGYQFVVLFIVTVIIISIFAGIFVLINDDVIEDAFYFSIITMISSDSIFEVAEKTPIVKILTLLLAFIGIIIFNGVLVAIIVTKVFEYLDSIKSGYGRIRKDNHFIILGTAKFLPYLLQELELNCIAEKKQNSVIVSCEDLTDKLRDTINHFKVIDLSLRKGLSYSKEHLLGISLDRARSVLVLGEIKKNDFLNLSLQLKTNLTIQSVISEIEKKPPTVFYSIPQKDKKIFAKTDTSNIFNINSIDYLFYSSKILSLTLREPVFWEVFDELLGFEGSEFYFLPNQPFSGDTVREAQFKLKQSIIIGFKRDDNNYYLPSPEDILQKDDTLIVVAENKLKALERASSIRDYEVEIPRKLETKIEKELFIAIIGVNEGIPLIIDELAKTNTKIIICDNQSITSFKDWLKDADRTIYHKFQVKPFRSEENNLLSSSGDGYIHYIHLEFNNDDLSFSDLPLESLDRIVVLADRNEHEDSGLIDAETLCKLMQIEILKEEKYPNSEYALLAEILSPDSEDAVRLLPHVSFVMGQQLLGKLSAMFMYDPQCVEIFNQLVVKGGMDLVLRDLPFKDSSFGKIFNTLSDKNIRLIGIINNYYSKDIKSDIQINPPVDTIINERTIGIFLEN